MIGLYICSLSSTIGSLLGTPRVLQGIAAEGIIPVLNPLAQGVRFFSIFIFDSIYYDPQRQSSGERWTLLNTGFETSKYPTATEERSLKFV
ncbi:unnamed protein product [Nippostrongylus brasiliensis]|uniref:Solute carrier family 12 member 8 (inferred by orthology to a human protein) n=1 Tax=Nippostrongylus brasiliensis TaxID=27835 RepID=A0A0N4XK98_NIPBR|nr:unnamed protein product [Nippostrongylus brasiliensis]